LKEIWCLMFNLVKILEHLNTFQIVGKFALVARPLPGAKYKTSSGVEHITYGTVHNWQKFICALENPCSGIVCAFGRRI